MIKIIDKFERITCNGCQMCKEICPKQAIKYEINNEGFWFPKVDYNKCVECGLCIRKCPNKTYLESKSNMPIVKAVWSIDDDVRLNSTSGGLFYEMASKVLKDGGYVGGCVYDDDFKGAHHVIINKVKDLRPLMVSKYVESSMEGIYPKIKEILDTGKKLLFVGAPCQCAGIISYLGKTYANLILVDFVCRGANSPKAWRKYIEHLERLYDGKIISFRCKDKSRGWESLGVKAVFNNGKEYYADSQHDLRVIAYHRGNLMERESCNECHFKNLPRYSDITLGDFWGIKKDEVVGMDKGVSLCFVNSIIGQKIFDDIKGRLHILDKTLDEAKAGNPAIYSSAPKGRNRDEFLSRLDEMPFDELVHKYRDKDPSFMYKCVRKIKRIIKSIIAY